MSTSPTPPPNPVQADLLAGRPVSFPVPTVPPPETPASRAARTIPAQWLQDLASPNTRKISVPILVTNAIIDGPLNLSYVTFECAVEFSGCEFTGGAVDFSFSTFSRSAKFTACRFTFSPSRDPNDDAPVSFRALHASADLILAGSVFSSKLDCSDIHVEEMLDASGANFAEVSFQRMVVAKSAYFSVDLQGGRTVFGGDASFLSAQIGANAEFGGALFSKKLTCDDIRIEGDAFFCTEQVEDGATLGLLFSVVAAGRVPTPCGFFLGFHGQRRPTKCLRVPHPSRFLRRVGSDDRPPRNFFSWSLGLPFLVLSSNEVLEGAPSFAFFAKGGLLPSDASHFFSSLLALGFAFSEN